MVATGTVGGARQVGEVQQLVVFQVGDGNEFAMPIERVQEVVRYEPPRSIASATPWMLGVTSLRGLVLPVCDLARRLGVPSDQPPQRFLIGTPDPRFPQLAFAVAAVEEIVAVESGDIEEPAGWHDAAISGIVRMGERIVVVLDPGLLATDQPHEPGEASAPAQGATTT